MVPVLVCSSKKATQKQRAYEREVRKYKRRISVGQAQDLDMMADRQRLGHTQALLREHCRENNLRRDYERERAYGVAKQPRGLGRFDFKNIRISGALNDRNDPDEKKRNAHAERYYNELRNRNHKSVISSAAKNSRFSKKEITAIFNHTFIEEHDLIKGRRRFDPDYYMSQSWQRLLEGKYIQKHDITMLKHELEEIKYLKQGFAQDEAHDLAQKRYNYSKEVKIWRKKTNN